MPEIGDVARSKVDGSERTYHGPVIGWLQTKDPDPQSWFSHVMRGGKEVAQDVGNLAKEVPIGAVEGGVQLATAPADIDWMTGGNLKSAVFPVPQAPKMPEGGVPGVQQAAATPAASTGKVVSQKDDESLPPSAQIMKQMGVTAPETTAGQYGRTIGAFLPTSVVPGGPTVRAGFMGEQVIPRTLNALRFGVGGGAASEGLGQATQGTPAEIPARVAGAILGHRATSKAITPNQTRPEWVRAIRELKEEGINPTVGQVRGLSATDPHVQQRGAYTATALRAAGEQGDRATPDVVTRMNAGIDTASNTLQGRNPLFDPPGLLRDLNGQTANYVARVPDDLRTPNVQNTVQSIARTFDPNLSPTVIRGNTGYNYAQWHRELGRLERAATNPEEARAYAGMRDVLDRHMEQSITRNNPADAGAFANLRQRRLEADIITQAAQAPDPLTRSGILHPKDVESAIVRTPNGHQSNLASITRAMGTIPEPSTSTFRSKMSPEAAVLGAYFGAEPITRMIEPTKYGYLASAAATAPAAALMYGNRMLESIKGVPQIQNYLTNTMLQKQPFSMNPARSGTPAMMGQALRGGKQPQSKSSDK